MVTLLTRKYRKESIVISILLCKCYTEKRIIFVLEENHNLTVVGGTLACKERKREREKSMFSQRDVIYI